MDIGRILALCVMLAALALALVVVMLLRIDARMRRLERSASAAPMRRRPLEDAPTVGLVRPDPVTRARVSSTVVQSAAAGGLPRPAPAGLQEATVQVPIVRPPRRTRGGRGRGGPRPAPPQGGGRVAGHDVSIFDADVQATIYRLSDKAMGRWRGKPDGDEPA